MYTVQVHWGLPNRACNDELEAKLSKWPAPFVLPLKGTPLAAFLDSEECKIDNEWWVATKAWADGFLYLEPVNELTVSPLPNEEETPYLETLLKYFPLLKEQWK
jgi:hypothetical protein